MEWLLIPAIIVLFFVIVIFIFNSLVKSKLKVENAWATIDTQLLRRYNLIPNLIESVKGYIKHEEKTITEIANSRSQYYSARTTEEKEVAANCIESRLKSIFAVAEKYPELKANQSFLNLQLQLAETENKIALSRQFYNDAVLMYNNAVMCFPKNIVAKAFNYKTISFLEVKKESKENVHIEF